MTALRRLALAGLVATVLTLLTGAVVLLAPHVLALSRGAWLGVVLTVGIVALAAMVWERLRAGESRR